jgi:glycosyltransferase involved in cell wall biosynthesis
MLFRAFAALHARYPFARLIKVGLPHFSAERHALARLAYELGVGDAVRFFDHVPEHELPLFYAAADVCALPSLYEGYGLPVIESLACGTPVVCADRTALAELDYAGVTHVPPTDAEFAAALEAVLTHGKDSAMKARDHADSPALPSWSDTVERALTVYRSTLDSAPRDTERITA